MRILEKLDFKISFLFFFSVEKGAPSVLYRDLYFKDC